MVGRRYLLFTLAATVFWLGGCASTPAARDPAVSALAPTGTLRVGVYRGSPTSLVTAADGQPAGVAHDLGRALARDAGIAVEMVEFPRVALVLEALKAGRVDFTFTNATESRARDMAFTEPLVKLELGYLVAKGSPISELAEVDRAAVRIGVSEGSTSQTTLGRLLRNAKLVPVASLDAARTLLATGELDAFATNKGILHELADRLPGARILEGRWGLEHLAIAVPKGRPQALQQVQGFARRVTSDGRLAAAVARSGLRGVASD